MLRSLLSLTRGSVPDYVFPTVNPEQDGPDCLQDCASCTIQFPAKVKVEKSIPLYGHIKQFHSHVLVATGRSDWKEKVEQERGSLMEAFEDSSAKSKRGRYMVSASNIQPPDHDGKEVEVDQPTTVLILPSFTFVDSVSQADVPHLVHHFIDRPADEKNGTGQIDSGGMTTRPCELDYVILLCSHKRRDARCGITAPLIKRELERHLRPLGLNRDADDSRPGGAGVFFVSHVGGHKFSANVLIYRKQDQQMIWLARVRPEHCEGIVKYTILEGKVVHPETQLRGGFDQKRGLTSW
ncbi:Actin patches distal protein 1 [Penicillium rolfsii]|nr:Actin patches distal protein 1 [Penicillium rolfsii]